MSTIFELVVVVIAMMGAFFMVFLFMFMLALFLSPVERALSKMVWDLTAPKPILASPKPKSFKDFSMKH